MAAPIVVNAILQERVNLVGTALGTTDVYFSVPTVSQSVVPNALKIQPLEEVFISIDITNGPVNIYLPSISDFGNFWNAKVYITLSAGGNTPALRGAAPEAPIAPMVAAGVNLYPFQGSLTVPADTLNGFTGKTLSYNHDSYFLHIVDSTTWIALFCAGPGAL
jgi:hypothetical protein